MDLSKLTSQQKQVRSTIRGFLLTATIEQMVQEKVISLKGGDKFRADVIQELIDKEVQMQIMNKFERKCCVCSALVKTGEGFASSSFLLTATVEQMEQEKAISLERGDKFRADAIQELIDLEQ